MKGTTIIAFVGALIVQAIADQTFAQVVYRDPDDRFSFQLPAGWTERVADQSEHPEWGTDGKLIGRNGDGFCWIWVQTEQQHLLSADGLERFKKATTDMPAARHYVEDMRLIGPSMTVENIKAENIAGINALQVRYSGLAPSDGTATNAKRALTWITLFSAQPKRNDIVWCTVATEQLDRVEPIISAMFHSYRTN